MAHLKSCFFWVPGLPFTRGKLGFEVAAELLETATWCFNGYLDVPGSKDQRLGSVGYDPKYPIYK